MSALYGKYLVGSNFDIPFEVIKTPDGGARAVIYTSNGKTKDATDLIPDYLCLPGKAERVTDKEFEKAKKERMREKNDKKLMKKKQINLVNLKELSKGRKWSELSEEEKDEISQRILNLISPESSSE